MLSSKLSNDNKQGPSDGKDPFLAYHSRRIFEWLANQAIQSSASSQVQYAYTPEGVDRFAVKEFSFLREMSDSVLNLRAVTFIDHDGKSNSTVAMLEPVACSLEDILAQCEVPGHIAHSILAQIIFLFAEIQRRKPSGSDTGLQLIHPCQISFTASGLLKMEDPLAFRCSVRSDVLSVKGKTATAIIELAKLLGLSLDASTESVAASTTDARGPTDLERDFIMELSRSPSLRIEGPSIPPARAPVTFRTLLEHDLVRVPTSSKSPEK